MHKSIPEVVSDAIAPLLAGGEIDSYETSLGGFRLLAGEDQETLGVEALERRIVTAAKRMSKKAEQHISQMGLPLFGDVPLAVPVGKDGKKIKALMSLTKDEAEWVISVRDKQIVADQKSARALKRLFKQAEPAWAVNPLATWAECLMAANDNTEQKVAA